MYGGIANSSSGWSTPQSAASGSLIITTLSASRMAGTFGFNTSAMTGQATGSVTVTEGSFDIALP